MEAMVPRRRPRTAARSADLVADPPRGPGSLDDCRGVVRPVVLAGCGHFPAEECPDETAAVLVDFLTDDPTGAPR